MRLKEIFYKAVAVSPFICLMAADHTLFNNNNSAALFGIAAFTLAVRFAYHRSFIKRSFKNSTQYRRIDNPETTFLDIDVDGDTLDTLEAFHKQQTRNILKRNDVRLYIVEDDGRDMTGVSCDRDITVTSKHLKEHSVEELKYIVSHEYSHLRHRDSRALGRVITLGWMSYLLAGYNLIIEPNATAIGGAYMAAAIGFGPIHDWLSRRFEYRADEEAVEMMNGNAEPAISALSSFAKTERKAPMAIKSRLHPPTEKRIQNLKQKFG